MAINAFFNVAVCAEIIALLAALLLITNKRFGYWRLFPLYLAFVLLIEFGGYYYKIHRWPNYFFYNLLWLVQATFFAFLFYRFHTSKRIKYLVFIVFGIFMLFFISEGIYRSFSDYFKYSRQFLSLFVVLFGCTFYYSIISNDSINTPLKFAPFWVVTGLFFYYLGSAAMFALYDKVSKIKLANDASFYSLVMGSLSAILYGTWIIAFVCRKRQTP